MSSNTDTVMGIYAAFGRGDLAHILDQMRDDVEWDHGIRPNSLPYIVTGTGKDTVTRFFAALAENVEFTTFEPGPPCEGGDTVIVPIREAGRNVRTGAPIREDTAAHIWTFDPEGKVCAFRHVFDIAAHETAAEPATATSSTV